MKTTASKKISRQIETIRTLPLWKSGAHVEKFPGGLTNFNYLVRVGPEKFVCHFAPASNKWLGLDRARELFNARAAHSIGIGAEVIKHYPKHRLVITRYLEGEILEEGKADARTIAGVARLLRLLHQSKLEFRGRFSPFADARANVRTVKRKKAFVPANINRLFDALDRLERELGAFSFEYPCHTDMVTANVLKTTKGVQLLDWEYAAMSDYRFDLAMFSVFAQLNPKQDVLLLKTYGKYSKKSLQDHHRLKAAALFREAVWGLVQNAVSDLPYDFKKHALDYFERFETAANESGNVNRISNAQLRKIADTYGISFRHAVRSKNAALSEVYVLDDAHVLRSRPVEAETVPKLRTEIKLFEKVKAHVPLQFPIPLKTRDQKPFVKAEGWYWTIYPFIHGQKIRCTWFDWYKATDAETRNLLRFERTMHESTRGLFPATPRARNWLVDDVTKKIRATRSLLTPAQQKRATIAIQRVKTAAKKFQKKDLCFIHGDFHFGNVVFEKKKPSGLIDFDWVRVGHPFEDLAFTVMMLLRDYRKPHFAFDEKRYRLLVDAYGLKPEDEPLLHEYMLLYAFFDIWVFRFIEGIPNKDNYLEFQQDLVADYCKRFA